MGPDDSRDSLRLGLQIDLICDAFEKRWRSGLPPLIEDYLVGLTHEAQEALLPELINVEVDYRARRGESVSAGDYLARFPSLEPDRLRKLVELSPALEPTVESTIQDHGAPAKVAQGQAIPASTSRPAIVHYFGDYELLEEWARGGMGTIYRARQVSLNRVVAVKLINTGILASSEEVSRFYKEAKSAGSLHHPNIVPVFEVGQHAGVHFYSMAFVDGVSLATKLADGPIDVKEAARLITVVSQAIEYAHQQGVIHRDIKPSNILIDSFGRPLVCDFGLAKRLTDNTLLTVSGDILGTPSYMPPEQAEGRADDVVGESDVYALGAVLYACITGRPPFQAATKLETLHQVVHSDPVAPRQLNSSIPRDIETIVLKCLEKSAAKRYASPSDLAADLERFLAGRPIVARPVGRMEKAYRWCRRHPSTALNIVGAFGVTALLLIAWIAAARFQQYREDLAEAQSLWKQLQVCAPAELPKLVTQIQQHPRLQKELQKQIQAGYLDSGRNSAPRYRAALVHLAHDNSVVPDVCRGWLNADWSEWIWVREQLNGHHASVLGWIKSLTAEEVTKFNSTQYSRLVAAVYSQYPEVLHDSHLSELLTLPTDPQPKVRALADGLIEELQRDPAAIIPASQALSGVRASLAPVLEEHIDYRSGLLRLDAPVTARFIAALYKDDSPALIGIGRSAHSQLFPMLFQLKDAPEQLIDQLRSLSQLSIDSNAAWDARCLSKRGQAMAGALLYAWNLEAEQLLDYSADPTVRSLIIDWLPKIDANPDRMLKRLGDYLVGRSAHLRTIDSNGVLASPVNPWLMDSQSARLRALLQIVGNYPAAQLKGKLNASLWHMVIDRYQHDPDPGVHSACEWLLQVQSPDRLSGLNMASDAPSGWVAGPNKHLLVQINGPIDFVAGATLDDPDRDAGNELDVYAQTNTPWSEDHPHTKHIPRSFEIDIHETSYGQMQTSNPKFHERQNKSLAPQPDQPACRVSWLAAARYCNWLSHEAGLSEDQYCFIEKSETEVELAENYLTREGYRLPTEAEWELACRAMTTTGRYFGDANELLGQYAWHSQNSMELSHRQQSSLKPNDLGLFHSLGNVYEWTVDRYTIERPAHRQRADDLEYSHPDWPHYLLKGGSMFSMPKDVRSSEYANFPPEHFEGNTGFRVARTIK